MINIATLYTWVHSLWCLSGHTKAFPHVLNA